MISLRHPHPCPSPSALFASLGAEGEGFACDMLFAMLELHRLLLGDSVRNDAFVKALKSVIKPGKTTIADIGSGTGYLSFVAEKLGAKACYLYEVSDLLPLSKKLAKENGIKHCTFFQMHSTEMKKPVQADVVVSETLGNWPYEENIIETLNDAHRFLTPDGMIIPQSLRSFVAPVITPRLYDELNVWDRAAEGLSFDAAKELCMNNMYVKEVHPDDLGEMKEWDAVNFTKMNSSVRSAIIEWANRQSMILYGFAVWWETTLIKNITLSTSPSEPQTHWKQIYLPLINPLPIQSSQSIRLHLTSDSRYDVKINVAWETTVLDAKGKASKIMKQDMRKGYLP